MKTKKCMGCGTLLQDEDPEKDGYVESSLFEGVVLCQRCFRLKNYNAYQKTTKSNVNYINILKNIDDSRDLVVYVVDIFNLNYDMNMIFKYFKNDVLLVITKRDILPKSVKEQKIVDYFKNNKRFLDVVLVSADRNYNLDKVYKKINEYKISDNVYVVGKTNAGKSTLINKIIKNYSSMEYDITTSYLPSTTLGLIKIKVNKEFTMIDTPGLIDETDIINYLDIKEIKRITPKKEIKPITFQIRGESSIIVESYVRVDTNCVNSFTFYLANELKIRKNSYKNDKLKTLKCHQIKALDNSDIVVNGLLWIKVVKACEVTLYTYDEVLVYTRENII